MGLVWSVMRTPFGERMEGRWFEEGCYLMGHKVGQVFATASVIMKVEEFEIGAAENLAYALNLGPVPA